MLSTSGKKQDEQDGQDSHPVDPAGEADPVFLSNNEHDQAF
jgi:hypothetical protein